MRSNSKKLANRDERNNRFARLRFKDNATLTDDPFITVSQLAKKIGLSKGTISNLEGESMAEFDAEAQTQGDVPPCNAQTLKAYHDYFKCSYPYLMGETAAKEEKYYDLGREPQLSALGDDFWDDLKSVLSDEYGEQYIYQYILTLMFSKPEELKTFLKSLYETLHDLHSIRSQESPASAEEVWKAYPLFKAQQSLIRYISDVLLPNVTDYGFSPHDEAQCLRAEETEAMLADLDSNDVFFGYIS